MKYQYWLNTSFILDIFTLKYRCNINIDFIWKFAQRNTNITEILILTSKYLRRRGEIFLSSIWRIVEKCKHPNGGSIFYFTIKNIGQDINNI